MARFEYWGVILNDLNINNKSVIAGIYRMRIGARDMPICLHWSHDVIKLVIDEKIHLERKSKILMKLFSLYQFIPENHIFKNLY